MYMLLIMTMVIASIVFITSVLLMSPKWWLGMGIGGMGNSGEYGSKKDLEGRLKTVAVVSATIFLLAVIFLPYFLPNVISA